MQDIIAPKAAHCGEETLDESIQTPSATRPAAEISRAYVERWCTYYELKVTLGKSWWKEAGILDQEGLVHTDGTACCWTVHRRCV